MCNMVGMRTLDADLQQIVAQDLRRAVEQLLRRGHFGTQVLLGTVDLRKASGIRHREMVTSMNDESEVAATATVQVGFDRTNGMFALARRIGRVAIKVGDEVPEQTLAMPTVWAPCPGNRKAVLTL